jgi:UDP-N-acetylmuramyl tripeptide synthase
MHPFTPCCHAQVPLGTSVKLLDKVFAQHPISNQSSGRRLSAGPPGIDADAHVDTFVSTDHTEHGQRFAQYRAMQQSLGRLMTRVLTPATIMRLLEASTDRTARRC